MLFYIHPYILMKQIRHISFFHPAKLLGTWFGAGLSPKAPGTIGSLAALPFAYYMQTQWGNEALRLASLMVFIVGWLATHIYLHYTASPDPKEIVIDEVSGQWFLLSFLYPTWTSYLIGFALFRFFDVIKPWPVSWADRTIKGGLGVMLDDVLAAGYPIAVFLLVGWIGGLIGHPFNKELLMGFLSEHHVF